MKYKTAILAILTIANPWFIKLIQEDKISTLLILLLTFSLFFLITTHSKKLIGYIALLCMLQTFLLVPRNLDHNLFTPSQEELYMLNENSSFYPPAVGRIFHNKVTLAINKIQQNLFDILDLNLYFFATHPRERLGVKEFEKYPFFLLPFFIIGIFNLFKERSPVTFGYGIFALFTSSVTSQSYPFGPILIIPILNISILLGLLKTSYFLRKHAFMAK